MRALVIARLTFQEALKRRLVLGVALLSVAFIVLYAYGFHYFVTDFRRMVSDTQGPVPTYTIAANQLVVLGFYTVNFLTGIMTIFASVGSIAGEIDSGVLHAIVPKPIARWEVVLGKYLGFAAMLAIYITVMVASVMLSARFIGDYSPPNVPQAILLIILVSLILLSLTMLGSTIFSTITNGVVVFMLYGIAMTGGLVEQIGNVLNNTTLINIGLITSIVLPSDSMWRLASYVVQPRLASNFFGANPFSTSSPPSALAVEYAIAYCVVLLVGAMLVFRRRDL